MPKIIHLVIVGEFHRDPATYSLMRKILELAKSRKQPVVFADEEDPSSSIEYKLQGNQQHNSIVTNAIMHDPNIAGLLVKNPDLYRSHFPLSCRAEFEKILDQHKVKKEAIPSIIGSLMGISAWPERIALWEYLLKESIVNCGIDIDSTTSQKLHHDPQLFKELELIRIRIMTANIKKGIEKHLPNGGLMIVCGGNNHVKNLTASVRYILSQDPKLPYQVIIQPIRSVSPYTIDGIPDHTIGIQELYKCMPPEIKAHYDKIEAPIEQCTENLETGEFNAPILDRLGKDFFSTYRIPACDADRKRQINDIFGLVTEEHPDGSATAQIHSAYLIGPVRRVLGIDRYRLKLNTDVEARLDSLREHCPEISIENEPSGAYLVTFPMSEDVKTHVQMVADDKKWEECKASSSPGLRL